MSSGLEFHPQDYRAVPFARSGQAEGGIDD